MSCLSCSSSNEDKHRQKKESIKFCFTIKFTKHLLNFPLFDPCVLPPATMSSRFSGGYPGFFNANGGGASNVNRSNYSQQVNYTSTLLPPVIGPRSELIGKRSLTEFQQQPSVYLRNVKPRVYNHRSEILVSPEVSSVSNFSSSSPVSQQFLPERFNTGNGSLVSNDQINKYNGRKQPPANEETERKMLNRLRELEKELLLDDEVENDAVSVVTDTEWSESIQKLLKPVNIISPSPTTSSSSSCASSSASVSPKQLISDATEAITDGKSEIAMELITRLNQFSNARGTPEQRLGCHMASALSSHVHANAATEKQISSVAELYKREHVLSTQLLYDKSPCFKLAFMMANNIILQNLSGSVQRDRNIHVVDFDIGHGLQYVFMIHEIAAARKVDRGTPISVKLTTFKDFGNGGVERLKLVGDGLKSLSNKLGVIFHYNVLDFKLSEISKQGLTVANDDVLAVNFAFKLNKLPDESVTVDNLRDEVLRRVKALSPAVVTVAEQDLNTNTASFTARVNDVFSYYTTFVDSFDATIPRDNPERVKIEEGLSRRIVNSVACEGRERVERCEVFGKWRARMRMAGFDPKPVSQDTADSLVSKVNWGTRGNPGFTVKEDSGGIRFGWLGRSLMVVSAWH
ncbi:hypothetical protein L1987_75095 [Smallanthus sonchifolius]|uniref:Uncharacterized protein n=1 Tax=Smallanthus sonchifolius TaxID=185202 RepID=A0ACB9A545_9ASTR|nr:hypothetical protein L1987_75095 [Smallanthus sonchifolius]